ncbi:MAG: HD domain-containing protein [Deltaproteobacteria bacterium]
MKKIYVKDIKERDNVSDVFLVTKKESGVSKSGKPYLVLKLMDSSGEIESRVWDDAERLDKNFQKNDIVNIKGYTVAYQGGLQINLSAIATAPEGQYSLRDFMPASLRDPAEMVVELDGVIASINDVNLKALLKAVFEDPALRSRFISSPAAKSMHHAYLSGLMEHVLSICSLAAKVSDHYGAAINKDLLISGALLHDIGKIYELSCERSFEYTDEGRLLGHITIGIELIDSKVREMKAFPRELAVLLKHMILSHHGHLEYGSPKRPKTIEAIVLYYLDDLDAKVSAVKSLIEKDADPAASWTPYQRIFERNIFKGTAPGEAPGLPPVDVLKADVAIPGRDDDDKPGILNLFS